MVFALVVENDERTGLKKYLKKNIMIVFLSATEKKRLLIEEKD